MLDRTLYPVDVWRLIETSPQTAKPGVAETSFSLGNGYLGFRGNHIEGRRAYEHGTFINGFHETFPIRHAEQAYGFAEVGQTIVNVPDIKVMRVYVDDEPLDFDEADIRDYERVLDLRTGALSRSFVWVTASGKHVQIRDARIVSFEERHSAALTLEVTVLNDSAAVTVSSQTLNRQDGEDVYGGATAPGPGAAASAPVATERHAHPGAEFDPRKAEQMTERVLQPFVFGADGERTWVSYRVANSGMTIAVATDHVIETAGSYTVTSKAEPDFAKTVISFDATPGETLRVGKVGAYHTSNGVPPSELVDRCIRNLDRVIAAGIPTLFAQQERWLAEFWKRSDVVVAGHDGIQQAVRWCLFQLAQCGARADGNGVSAKGVSGSGYSGHYFWDTEIYVLPFYTYTSPEWAKNALRFRSQMLDAARNRAAKMNEAGALFSWRTINGEEASAYYAAGTAQYHINADISFALAKYVRATGDYDFLAREGVDIAVETARMWSSLGFWRGTNGDSSFHIHGVTGPDEYTTVVNDNMFTNVMARFNLRFAARTLRVMKDRLPDAYDAAVERLGIQPEEADRWWDQAAAMHIPYSDALGIHPQDANFLDKELWDLENTPDEKHPLLLHFHPLVIYRHQVLKQADVVLALFLQGNHFTAEQKLADFDYYDPLTTGDSTLSAVVQSILAAEVGYQDLALEYFEHALYVDLADLHSNASDGVHVASAGGVWTALVSGFGGMRDYFGLLSFDPRLPEGWDSISFPLRWRDAVLQVTVEPSQLTVAMAEMGAPVEFEVRGEEYTVTADAPIVVPLSDQGPRIEGRPTLKKLENERRDDGTLLSSTVPTTTDAFFLRY